jgi:hypothetical protein
VESGVRLKLEQYFEDSGHRRLQRCETPGVQKVRFHYRLASACQRYFRFLFGGKQEDIIVYENPKCLVTTFMTKIRIVEPTVVLLYL